MTIYDHTRIFFFIFYLMTFDELAKVKQGHSKMGYISRVICNSMTNIPWKFYAFIHMCTIIALIRPTNELWKPPKVKKGHGKTGSISGLNYHGMTKNPWKFHDHTPIHTIVTLVPVPLKISGVIWPLMTLWRLKGAIFIIFQHKVWFIHILS